MLEALLPVHLNIIFGFLDLQCLIRACVALPGVREKLNDKYFRALWIALLPPRLTHWATATVEEAEVLKKVYGPKLQTDVFIIPETDRNEMLLRIAERSSLAGRWLVDAMSPLTVKSVKDMFVAACAGRQSDNARWLLSQYGLDIVWSLEALEAAVKSSSPFLGTWALCISAAVPNKGLSSLQPQRLSSMLKGACTIVAKKLLDLIEAAYTQTKFELRKMVITGVLGSLSTATGLTNAKWISVRYRLTKEDLTLKEFWKYLPTHMMARKWYIEIFDVGSRVHSAHLSKAIELVPLLSVEYLHSVIRLADTKDKVRTVITCLKAKKLDYAKLISIPLRAKELFCTNDGNEILTQAVASGNTDIVAWALQVAKPLVSRQSYIAAFDLACISKKYEARDAIDAHQELEIEDILATDYAEPPHYKSSTLWQVCMHGELDCVKWLVDHYKITREALEAAAPGRAGLLWDNASSIMTSLFVSAVPMPTLKWMVEHFQLSFSPTLRTEELFLTLCSRDWGSVLQFLELAKIAPSQFLTINGDVFMREIERAVYQMPDYNGDGVNSFLDAFAPDIRKWNFDGYPELGATPEKIEKYKANLSVLQKLNTCLNREQMRLLFRTKLPLIYSDICKRTLEHCVNAAAGDDEWVVRLL